MPEENTRPGVGPRNAPRLMINKKASTIGEYSNETSVFIWDYFILELKQLS